MKNLSGTILMAPFGFFGSGRKDPPEDDGKTVKAAVRNISAKEAKAIMDEGKPYTLLDVRTSGEFGEGHIKGAKLIPVDEVEFRAPKELPDKNAVILVYCASGARSARASKILAKMGYVNVNNFGGIMNWPYETAGG